MNTGPVIPYAVSWSGGKDSCMALHRTAESSGPPSVLFSMLDETGRRSRSHGLHRDLLAAQAGNLGVQLVTASASWNDYERVFIEQLRTLAKQGIKSVIFGDLDLVPHRLWEEKVCAAAGLTASLPLWQCDRTALVLEFISLGYKAVIVTVNTRSLPESYLGREIDKDILREFAGLGVDPAGENGEYHTAVLSGPLFAQPVAASRGAIAVPAPGYAQMELLL